MNNFRIIKLDNKKEWDKLTLNNYHYSGQTWEYSKLQNIINKYDTFLINFKINNREYFCPFQKNRVKGVEYVFTPNGYSGFNLEINLDIFQKLINFFNNEKFLTAYVAFNPFVISKKQISDLKLKKKNDAYIIDLNKKDNQIRINYKRNILKNIELTLKNNFIVKSYSKNNYNELEEIYLESLKKFKISKSVKEDKKMINFLLEKYEKKICLVAFKDQRIYSASIFLLGSDTSEYFINISKTNYNFISSYLIDKSYEILRKKGIFRLNLGGSVKDRPGIEQFKKSFRADQYSFFHLKNVIDHLRYNELCKEGIIFPTFKKI